jgi:hypothetical protein
MINIHLVGLSKPGTTEWGSTKKNIKKPVPLKLVYGMTNYGIHGKATMPLCLLSHMPIVTGTCKLYSQDARIVRLLLEKIVTKYFRCQKKP